MTHTQNWFALLTRSNFEQTVHKTITQKKIESFLPTVKRKSRRRDRHLMIDLPLFPGYIFVKSGTDSVSQLNILKTTGAVRLLGNQSGPVPVPSSQIDSLRILTQVETNVITGTNIRLKKGDPVMILEGPMAGVRGEFTYHKGKGRVVIKIDVLGQYAGVEVEEDNIEKVPDLFA